MVTKTVDREELRALRGTKRTCQNADCGSRFYDLARDPITCPICSTVYELARQALQATQAPQRKVARPAAPKKFDVEEVKPAAPEDELAAVGDAEEPAAGEEDDTFLEEIEEEPNVTGIIDAPIEDTDEKG
jgi:uncharacterized protein (TIGR02300 family)